MEQDLIKCMCGDLAPKEFAKKHPPEKKAFGFDPKATNNFA